MPIYLKLDGITGDATQQDHQGWMDIQSMHWNVSRNVNTTVGSAQNREASQPNVSEITLTKVSDSSHSQLYQESTTGSTPKTAVIDLVTTGNPGVTYCTYTLTNTLISGMTAGTSGDRPTETLTLNFTKKEVTYHKLDANNQSVGASRATYDQGSAAGTGTGA